MRSSVGTVTVVMVAALAAGCGSTAGTAVPVTTPPLVARPLVERELDGLLLSPEQVNATMGSAAMTVLSAQATMSDNSATMAPPECLVIDGAAEAAVYAGSGFWAEREQSMNDGDKFTHYLKQAVVLFPTQDKALVLVTDRANATLADFRAHARAKGASELMVPSRLVTVAALPLLGSGKVDHPAVAALAAEPVARAA